MTITTDKNGVDWLDGAVARKELRDRHRWDMATLRYRLAYQQDTAGQYSYGEGRCGHNARGSGFCATCLQGEIDRRLK